MPLDLPINAPAELAQFTATLLGHWDEQQRVRFLGMHSGSGQVTLRILASAATTQVRVHQQALATYGAADHTEDIDCRVDRQQEVTLDIADGQYVWLIPLWSDQGTLRAFDGDTGPDQMTLVDLLTLDGAGSGLDADTLDGQHGSFYQDASNLIAGVLADARVQESNVTQHQAALSITESQISDLDHYDDADADVRVALGIAAATLADLASASASDIDGGTLADARLSSNVPLKNAAEAISGAWDFDGGVDIDSALRVGWVSDLHSKGDTDGERYIGPHLNIDVASITGTIAVRVPHAACMHILRISIYNYSEDASAAEFIIGGYTYSANGWIRARVGAVGGGLATAPDDRYKTVRLVRDDTESAYYILFGDSSTTWNYPKIFVEDMQGFNTAGLPSIGFYEAGVNAEPSWTHTTTKEVNEDDYSYNMHIGAGGVESDSTLYLRGTAVHIDDGGTNTAVAASVKSITSSTSTPSGDYPVGALHLIY